MNEHIKCFFCGESNQIVLEEHHIYPKWAEKVTQDLGLPNEIVVLCRNCHKKLHHLLRYYKGIVERVIPEPEEISVKPARPTEEIIRRERILTVLGTLLELEKAYEASHRFTMVPREVLVKRLDEKGFRTKEVNKILDELLSQGVIYSPRNGYLKKI